VRQQQIATKYSRSSRSSITALTNTNFMPISPGVNWKWTCNESGLVKTVIFDAFGCFIFEFFRHDTIDDLH